MDKATCLNISREKVIPHSARQWSDWGFPIDLPELQMFVKKNE